MTVEFDERQSAGAYDWAAMLDEFRVLGGTAENVEQRIGKHGNGLFPIDPARTVVLDVPDKLLVDSDHLVREGDELIVSPQAPFSAEIKSFYGRYQKHFSWGADGCRHVERFEHALTTLPEPLLAYLQKIRVLDLRHRHRDSWPEMIRRRFLESRHIIYHDRRVIMPVIELVNHAAQSPGFGIGKGVRIQGVFADEVTVNYSVTLDSLGRFLSYGFVNQEPGAYALPMSIKTPDGQTVLVSNEYTSVDRLEGFPTPVVTKVEEDRYRLSHVRLGLTGTPRVPRTMFRKVLPQLSADEADELFERIRCTTQVELCRMLELAEESDTSICREFRRAVICQLRALSYGYGARPGRPKSAAH